MTTLTLSDVLPRLSKVKAAGPGEWRACCPAHEDINPSLSIKQAQDGRLLIHCFAGCTFQDVLDALNKRPSSDGLIANGNSTKPQAIKQQQKRIVAIYDYKDVDGKLCFQKVRFEPKDFRVRRPDGNGGYIWNLDSVQPVLYRLPDLLDPGEDWPGIYIVEGEKDADRLANLGLIATCNYDGAGKWRAEYNQYFTDRAVYIIADNDEPGRKHAELVASNLINVTPYVRIVTLPDLPEHGDVSNWLDAGHSKEEFERVALTTPKWEGKSVSAAVPPEPESPPILEAAIQVAVTDPTRGLRPIHLYELLEQVFPPLEFLVDELLAKGHLGVLGGRPKSGKSWLVLQLAQAIDEGRPFLGKETQKGKVLYVALEDGRRRVHQRANIIKWHPQQAQVLFEVAHFDGENGHIGPGLVQIGAIAPAFDLIIIDTLIATLSGRANENDNVQMGAVMNELARIAHETETAVLLVHHTGKGNSENVFDLLRGASAIRGGYDVGFLLQRKQDEREAILYIESRDVEVSSMTIQQAGNGAGWECLGNGTVIQELRAGRKVVQALVEHGDGQTVSELAQILKLHESSVRRQLGNAEKHGYVRRETGAVSSDAGKPADLWYITEKWGT